MRAMVAAIALFVSAVSAWAEPPTDAVRRKDAGNQHLQQRHYDAARDQYLAALKLAPEYSDVHYNLGVLYFFRLGDYPRALYHFVRYAHLKPDASDLGQVQSLTTQALEKIEDAERAAYAETLRSGTVGALEAFRQAHPQSSYADDAERKLGLLAEYDKEVRRREQATREAYERAVARATPGAMNEFLQTYPGAPQSAEATRLRALWAEQRAADEKAFLAATDAGTATALAAFLEQRPQSAYASEAQKQLQQLHAAEQGAAAAALAAADRAWEDAAAADSIAAYQRFVTGYPDHTRAAQARDRITSLEQRAEAEQLRAEADRVWQAVEGENRASAYRDFAVAYPDHPNATEAGRRATALEAAAATAAVEAQARSVTEESRATAGRAWEDATRASTVVAYQAFLAAHPDHPKADLARQEIERLHDEAGETAAREKADRAWETAYSAGTLAAYEDFLATYPGHSKAETARRETAGLKKKSANQRADAVWSTAAEANTIATYRQFLISYPDHSQTGKAERAIRKLEKQADADAKNASREAAARAWATAEGRDTTTGYEEFSRAWPDHAQADEARRRAAAMAAAASQTPVAAPPTPEQPATNAVTAAWAKARDTDTVAAYESFLTRHPEAEEAAAARSRLAELKETEQQSSEDSQLSRSKRKALSRYRRMLITE